MDTNCVTVSKQEGVYVWFDKRLRTGKGPSFACFIEQSARKTDVEISVVLSKMSKKQRDQLELYVAAYHNNGRIHAILVRDKMERGQEHLLDIKVETCPYRNFPVFGDDDHFEIPDIWSIQSACPGFADEYDALYHLYHVFRCGCQEHWKEHQRRANIAAVSDSPQSFSELLACEGTTFTVADKGNTLGLSDYLTHVRVAGTGLPFGLRETEMFSVSGTPENDQRVPGSWILSSDDASYVPQLSVIPVCESAQLDVTKPEIAVLEVEVKESAGYVPKIESPETVIISYVLSRPDQLPKLELNVTTNPDGSGIVEVAFEHVEDVETQIIEGSPVGAKRLTREEKKHKKRLAKKEEKKRKRESLATPLKCLPVYCRRKCTQIHAHDKYAAIRPMLVESYLFGRSMTHFFDMTPYVLGYLRDPYLVSFCAGTRHGLGLADYVFSESPRVKHGAKLIFSKPKGVYVFKDGKKPLDFIGGKIEPGESPVECVKREYLEEVGVPLTQPFQFATLSATWDKDVIWVTWLFHCRWRPDDARFYYMPLGTCMLESAPWLPRLLRAWSLFVVLGTRSACSMRPFLGML